MAPSSPDLSFVIPVYNGAQTIGCVVDRILHAFTDTSIEIVLVNDGSADNSALVCRHLVNQFPRQIIFLDLARNFGEHNAVLAGAGSHNGRKSSRCFLTTMDKIRPKKLSPCGEHFRKNSWMLSTVDIDQASPLVSQSWKSSERRSGHSVAEEASPYLSVQLQGDEPVRDRSDCAISRSVSLHRRPDLSYDAANWPDRSGTCAPNCGPIRLQSSQTCPAWLNMFLGFSIAPLRAAVFLGGCSLRRLAHC